MTKELGITRREDFNMYGDSLYTLAEPQQGTEEGWYNSLYDRYYGEDCWSGSKIEDDPNWTK